MIDKTQALEELESLEEFFLEQRMRNFMGPRNAERQLKRVQLLRGYVHGSKGRLRREVKKPYNKTLRRRVAEELSERTSDAYSSGRYASWIACAEFLLDEGWSEEQAVNILRSKIMWYAADQSGTGRATTKHLRQYLSDHRNAAQIASEANCTG